MSSAPLSVTPAVVLTANVEPVVSKTTGPFSVKPCVPPSVNVCAEVEAISIGFDNVSALPALLRNVAAPDLAALIGPVVPSGAALGTAKVPPVSHRALPSAAAANEAV